MIEECIGQAAMESQPLAQLWVARSPEHTNTDHLNCLSRQEHDRWSRLRGDERKARFACAHALLRQVLARHLSVPVTDLKFSQEPQNRPILCKTSAPLGTDIDFNISTTQSIVAVALSRRARIGVDVERPTELTHNDALAAQYLTATERDWVKHPDGSTRFAQIWTLKEALSKAHGEGLGLGFNQIQLLPREDGFIPAGMAQVITDEWRLISWSAEIPGALALLGAKEGNIDFAPQPVPGFNFLPVTVIADQTGS